MAFVNYNNKEITVKIVYYGPALSGKTTCLKYIYSDSGYSNKGKLITLDTDGDRTLFFDFLPFEMGKIGNYNVKVQLYTVPGQVAYDTTRKLVLQGADGIIFVADSQPVMREQNIESFANLRKNLELNKINSAEIPLILHYNKRDLDKVLTEEELNMDLNLNNYTWLPTVATSGENVLEGIQALLKQVIMYLKNKLSIFQKDKTVMFSREEMTAKHQSGALELPDMPNNVTRVINRDESAFQLSDPEPSKTMAKPESTEEIFNLEDDNIMAGLDIDYEASHLVLDNKYSLEQEQQQEHELDVDEQTDGSNKKTSVNEVMADSRPANIQEPVSHQEPVLLSEEVSESEEVSIPVNLTIPKGQKEMTIKLNLTINIKQ